MTRYLNGNEFKEEFSHTLLHNQDVFRNFQKIQEEEKRKEVMEERRRQEEA